MPNISDFSDVQVGDKPVQCVYVGDKEVWCRSYTLISQIPSTMTYTSVNNNLVGFADNKWWYAKYSSGDTTLGITSIDLDGNVEEYTSSFTQNDRQWLGSAISEKWIVLPPRNGDELYSFNIIDKTFKRGVDFGGTGGEYFSGAVPTNNPDEFILIARSWNYFIKYNAETDTYSNLYSISDYQHYRGIKAGNGAIFGPWNADRFLYFDGSNWTTIGSGYSLMYSQMQYYKPKNEVWALHDSTDEIIIINLDSTSVVKTIPVGVDTSQHTALIGNIYIAYNADKTICYQYNCDTHELIFSNKVETHIIYGTYVTDPNNLYKKLNSYTYFAYLNSNGDDQKVQLLEYKTTSNDLPVLKDLVGWYAEYVNKGIKRVELSNNTQITQWDSLTCASMPLTAANGLVFYNSEDSLDFSDDATYNGLNWPIEMDFQNDDWTMFIVIKSGDDGNVMGGATNSFALRNTSNKIYNFKIYIGTVNSYTGPELTGYNIIGAFRSGSNMGNRWNGDDSIYEEVARLPEAPTTTLGYASQETNLEFNGAIKEILFYNRLISMDDVVEVEKYLSLKYNIHVESKRIKRNGLLFYDYMDKCIKYQNVFNELNIITLENHPNYDDIMNYSNGFNRSIYCFNNTVYFAFANGNSENYYQNIYKTSNLGETWELIYEMPADPDYARFTFRLIYNSYNDGTLVFNEQRLSDDFYKYVIVKLTDSSGYRWKEIDQVDSNDHYLYSVTYNENGDYLLGTRDCCLRVNSDTSIVRYYADVIGDVDYYDHAKYVSNIFGDDLCFITDNADSGKHRMCSSNNGGASFGASLSPISGLDVDDASGNITILDSNLVYFITKDFTIDTNLALYKWNNDINTEATRIIPDGYDNDIDEYLCGVEFVNNTTYYIVYRRAVYQTTDGGDSFTKIYDGTDINGKASPGSTALNITT